MHLHYPGSAFHHPPLKKKHIAQLTEAVVRYLTFTFFLGIKEASVYYLEYTGEGIVLQD